MQISFTSFCARNVKTFFWTVVLLHLIVQTSAAQCLTAPEREFSAATTVRVSNVSELQTAISNLQPDTRVLIAPGTYQLESTLYVTKSDVVITGDAQDCDSVVLVGKGMENSNYGDVRSGIWINSDRVSVANLTIRDVYFHPIELNSGPDDIHVYNVSMLNAGEQFLKASSAGGFGLGSDRGRVEYSTMEYLTNPPRTDHGGGTGYTNGVDVHGGTGWLIKNNVFKNFHTRDSDDHLFNPAILMWNGSADTIVENNTFINVDRAIAFGLVDRANDHSGGIIRNNMVYLEPNLYSSTRKNNSDGQIIVWSSPNAKVLHNTVRTNGNTNKSIELRFGSGGAEVVNNLTDAPIVYREGFSFSNVGNATITGSNIFVDEANGDLHLAEQFAAGFLTGTRHPNVPMDFDGQDRGITSVYVGADSLFSSPPVVGSDKISLSLLYLLLLDEDSQLE